MSTHNRRKPGQPVCAPPQPRLRPVPCPDERPRPEADPELRATLVDMQRRYRVQRERLSLGDEPEAA